MNEQDFAELAAGYVLHALSPEDTDAFRAARRQHPEWEHYVTADAATAALLAEAVVEVQPPQGVRAALLVQIAGSGRPVEVAPLSPDTAADSPLPPAEPPRRTSSGGTGAPAPGGWRPRAWFTLAASLVLLVGVGWGAVFVGQQLNPPASVVALNEIEAAPDAQAETVTLPEGGEATAHWAESVGKVVLVTDGLPEIAEDKSYELWFVRDGEPISAGVFAADDGSATALLSGAMEPGDVIAVTVEVAGGSPTGLPTTDPIVAIPTQDS
ncbi:anti-sigma factor [Microbacterium sp. zg.B48]|uniref:anti-sigma factor n=1 Tax=Microbacterium sp. zg.B48 TaxID=2969408 RepID=UPI00214C7581|nr:anti-sigma factor [Microbacterium sp. zg.B48]MCR2762585.1 anti-sigma factor [Microbacterium sp. zg.B48]